VKDPKTPAEWHEAVNLAELYNRLESARAYGFIRSNLSVDVDRVDTILARGRVLGIVPNEREVEHLLRDLLSRGGK
jgi:hypothetical protein